MRDVILQGNALERLKDVPDQSVHCVVTSPPYWGLRDYGVEGQIGLEESPDQYVQSLVDVFREVWRALRGDGTLWLNLGDCYATGAGKVGSCPGGGDQGERREGPVVQPNRMPISGLKPKDLVGMPWRVAFALQSEGWYLRQDIIWHKPNPMPESVKDRCTKSHEYIFLMSKSRRYYFDSEAIQEPLQTHAKANYPARAKATGCGSQGAAAARGNDRDNSGGFPPSYMGSSFNKGKTAQHRKGSSEKPRTEAAGRNKRSVWTVATKPYTGAHFAVFPPDLIKPCILAGCPEGGVVLDPFIGSGTVAVVARELGRSFLGIELNPKYIELCTKRVEQPFLV